VVAIEWLALALVAVSYPLWLLIYVRYLLPKIREDNIGALERGEIEINPDWFSGVIDSIVERTRHLMLADLGNLARAPAAALGAAESDLGGGGRRRRGRSYGRAAPKGGWHEKAPAAFSV